MLYTVTTTMTEITC